MSQEQGEGAAAGAGAGGPAQTELSTGLGGESQQELGEEALQSTHDRALESIRKFLSETTAYSILPESFRLIVLDNELTVKGALGAMTSNGQCPCPLRSERDSPLCDFGSVGASRNRILY